MFSARPLSHTFRPRSYASMEQSVFYDKARILFVHRYATNRELFMTATA